MAEARLALSGLTVAIGERRLLVDVSLAVASGEVLGLVGPSGGGKTLTARSLVGMVDLDPGVIAGELILADGATEIRPYAGQHRADRPRRDAAFAGIRGAWVGLLPQDAPHALDPMRTVGWQVARSGPPGEVVDVVGCLARAGLTDPAVADRWPHELSGGMARRVTIAQALARRSRFLVVDEPTTGLDADAVHGLCAELARIARETGVGLVVITHDLRILPGLADRLVFLDGGRVVEELAGGHPDRATSELGRRLLAATARIDAGRVA